MRVVISSHMVPPTSILILILFIACIKPTAGFQNPPKVHSIQTSTNHIQRRKNILKLNNSNDSSSSSKDDSSNNNIDSNLIRPPINIRKESILFSDNPTTAANNNISKTWLSMRLNLPYIITGASKDDDVSPVDKNPIGAIYNVMFVRLPTILAGLVYSKNLVQGHPLFCDVGAGPFEIPPLIVYGVLLVILR